MSLIIISSLFATIAMFTSLSSLNNNEITEIISTTKNEIVYTLKSYKGKIALFIGDETVPYEIFDVYLFSLPEKDVNVLENGIKVVGINKVQALIEDFTS